MRDIKVFCCYCCCCCFWSGHTIVLKIGTVLWSFNGDVPKGSLSSTLAANQAGFNIKKRQESVFLPLDGM